MSIAEFRRLTGESENIVDLLAAPDTLELEAADGNDGAWDHREVLK
jgi:hypothetical protein